MAFHIQEMNYYYCFLGFHYYYKEFDNYFLVSYNKNTLIQPPWPHFIVWPMFSRSFSFSFYLSLSFQFSFYPLFFLLRQRELAADRRHDEAEGSQYACDDENYCHNVSFVFTANLILTFGLCKGNSLFFLCSSQAKRTKETITAATFGAWLYWSLVYRGSAALHHLPVFCRTFSAL